MKKIVLVSKKWLLCAAFAMLASNLSAQNTIALTVTDISNVSVTQKINANASALLTEFNKAYSENRTPSLYNIDGLSRDAKSSILSMWEMAPFYCTQSIINERGLRMSSGGWQVRNIPLFLKNMPMNEASKEIVINFDKYGEIDDIYFSIFDNMGYNDFMQNKGNDETDLRRRQAILNFVENFRTAYNRKDIDLLGKVFSDDALIITGKVVKQTKADNVFLSEKIEYHVKNKKEYIASLRSAFQNNTRINVIFDDIEVSRHPKYDEIYGVTLKQGWNSDKYSDIGFLFLMIDFRDGENMMIHVRAWQPEKVNERQLRKNEKISLGDFIIEGKD